MGRWQSVPGLLALLVLLAGCGPPAEESVAVSRPEPSAGPQFPEFADAGLAEGREVWLDTCKGCHAYGTAGAPVIGDHAAWAPRIAQGEAVLYQHALEGFFGPMGTMMPPRGGNPELTDDQVRLAVDYVVAASR